MTHVAALNESIRITGRETPKSSKAAGFHPKKLLKRGPIYRNAKKRKPDPLGGQRIYPRVII